VVVSHIDLKYKPAYGWMFFSIPLMILELYGLFFFLINWTFDWSIVILGVIIFPCFYLNLTSFKKNIRIAFFEEGYLIFVNTNLIRKKARKIPLTNIERIWLHRTSINWIPIGSLFKYSTKREKYSLLDLNNMDGYLPTSERQKFINYLKTLNPNIKFGYIK